MSENVKDVTDDTFKDEVLQSDLPVLVDFWAPWCGPCRMVSPVVEEIARENSEKLKVVKVNTDENPQVSAQYQIMSIPTLMVLKGGEVVGAMVGARPKEAMLRELQPHLG